MCGVPSGFITAGRTGEAHICVSYYLRVNKITHTNGSCIKYLLGTMRKGMQLVLCHHPRVRLYIFGLK